MKKSLTAIILIFSISRISYASQSESGLMFLQPTGARPVGLGEAFTSATNDITALEYNPATLPTLNTGNASFLYQKGLSDDAYGHLALGLPTKKGGFGFSIGYYDAGSINLSDGISERQVNAQRDVSVSLGMAHRFNKTNLGANLKYLTSKLAETESATAYAADMGLLMNLNSRMNLGLSLINLGTPLEYSKTKEELPLTARSGLSYGVPMSWGSILLLSDVSYRVNRREMIPAVGIEFSMGILSMRAGYKGEKGGENISVGTGFLMGQTSVDYAFKMMDQNNAIHQISFAMRFQGPSNSSTNTPSLPVEFDRNADSSLFKIHEKNNSKDE